jgi:opacity protein-like surface antigen
LPPARRALAALTGQFGIPSVSDATDWAFGYQVIAGLRYDVTPELAIDVDYHYLATSRGHYITSPSLIVDGVYTGNIKYTSGYATQSILASLIWRFDAPMLPLSR